MREGPLLSACRPDFAIAVEWWRENRPAAPDLLEHEMRVVVARLADVPLTGRPVLNTPLAGLRVASLEESRYHVYYRVIASREVVQIIRVWHMSRRSPDL